jgi:hypothetical protein
MLRRIDIRRSWQLAREQFAALVAERDELRFQLEWAEHERDQYRARLEELQRAVEQRWKAEAELSALHRERDLQLAMRQERDPTKPMN